MANEIIERNGRYFVQCSDGEYETTLEGLEQAEEGRKALLAYLEMSQKMYGHKKWTLGEMPPNADFHVILALQFENLQRFFEEKYHAGESLWTSYQMCKAAIVVAKERLCNPHADVERENAWIGRWQAIKEFLDLFPKRGSFDETPPYALPAPAAKGTPIADVRRFFPAVATTLGNNPTDESALADLAVWLMHSHWTERHAHRPESVWLSLAGRLREQQAAHLHAGKFLKACGRLHEALTPLAATEQDTKALLGKEYTAQSRNNLQVVLTWWAGWIREQTEAQRNPAGAYLAALKRVPIVEEHDNGTPRYSVPPYLLDWDGFSADIAPLRQAFDDALPGLTPDQKRALRQDVEALLSIEPERLKRQQEQFDRQDYFPANLPTDYPRLRFEVAGQPGGFFHAHQWVSTVFWGGLRALLHYKQMEARDAFEKLNAALGEALPTPEPPKNSKHLDLPAPNSPRPEAPTGLPI